MIAKLCDSYLNRLLCIEQYITRHYSDTYYHNYYTVQRGCTLYCKSFGYSTDTLLLAIQWLIVGYYRVHCGGITG